MNTSESKQPSNEYTLYLDYLYGLILNFIFQI